jgi:hypothetical protein
MTPRSTVRSDMLHSYTSNAPWRSHFAILSRFLVSFPAPLIEANVMAPSQLCQLPRHGGDSRQRKERKAKDLSSKRCDEIKELSMDKHSTGGRPMNRSKRVEELSGTRISSKTSRTPKWRQQKRNDHGLLERARRESTLRQHMEGLGKIQHEGMADPWLLPEPSWKRRSGHKTGQYQRSAKRKGALGVETGLRGTCLA